MPGSEETIRIIDVDLNRADIAEVISDLGKLDEKMKSISGISIFGKTTNASEARAQQQQMAAGMQQIAELQQKMIDLENQLAAAKAKGAGSGKAKTDEEIRATVELAEAKRKNLAAVKDQVRYDQAEIDSIVRKRIELKQLQAQYDSLSATARSADTGKGLLTQIQEMDAGLKNLEGSTGRFQRNVGNYSGALKVLEEQLQKTTAQMANMENRSKTTIQNLGAANPVGFNPNQWKQGNTTSLAGAGGVPVAILNEDAQAYMKLGQQAQWLNTIIQKQEGGFSSVTMQIRASERALISMREAGLEGTEAFEALRMETVAAARDMKEFQRQQKLLESELPALKALTLAAKGLGGAYAIGSGLTNVFAADNEKLQEKMNEMIAVMMILQGLEEAWQLVNQAGAAAMAFKTTATNAATFATELFAAATGEATAAMTALDAVMIASGIGAIVAALGGLIYLMSKATVDTNQLFEAQTKLNESYKEYYDTLIKSNQALGEELEKQDQVNKRLEEVQAVNVRSIRDQENLNALKRTNADADKKRAAEEMEEFKKRIDSSEDLQGQYDEQIRRLGRFKELSLEYQMQITKGKQYGDHTNKAEEFLKNNEIDVKRLQSEADATKVKLDRYNELTKAQEDSDQALKMLNAEDQKFAHELYERKVKALTEIANLMRGQSADLLKVQGAAAGPGDAQLKALEAEKTIRSQIITASRDQELRAEGLTGEERALIRRKAYDQLMKLDEEFIGREAVSRYNAKNQEVNDEIETNAALLKQREQFFARQEEQAKTHAANQKSYLETQRDGELTALLQTHSKNNPTGKNEKDLMKYNERKLQIETEYNNKILQADEDLNRKQIALNNLKIRDLQSQTGGTSAQQQQRQKDLDDLNKSNNDLSTKSAGNELSIEQNTANLKQKIAQDTADKKIQTIDMVVEAEQQAEKTVEAFVKGAYEHQINLIDRQIRKNNELKETETARIQNSTMSETQRAAAATRLALETDQRNQALERKKHLVEVREAEFDRDKGVLDVGVNTAVAIMKAVAASPETGGLPFSAIAAAMGAAQIAAILAKPIPKYETGTDFHPGGLMMVHPGEMMVDPSGNISMTPDKAALTFGERGTKVIPKNKTDMMNDLLLASILNGGSVQQDNRLYDEVRGVRESNIQLGRDIVAAIKKQKPSETHVHVDANFLTYIKTCL